MDQVVIAPEGEVETAVVPARKPRQPTPRKPRAKRPARRKKRPPLSAGVVALHALEAIGLLCAALVAVLAALGHAADWFAGPDLWAHLFPFAGAVLGMSLTLGACLWGWTRGRRAVIGRVRWLPPVVASTLAVAAAWFATQPTFQRELGQVRSLVGGQAQAERQAIAHQVFAAYRRADLQQVRQVLERARVYEATVREAAAAFEVDAEVLIGVGAAESSFYPRDSRDGGRGLFQITAPPAPAVAEVRTRLNVERLDPLNQRHNAFVAAATLRHYLAEMRGDLFLGLLAYNIGPRNGGLRSIMKQYGARDFVTIQPYLQHLPRDYPIRVLAAALAYRLWHTGGTLPRYEEGGNAAQIQSVGIPGLTRTVRNS